jgi:DSBA-like thioredoxin domain
VDLARDSAEACARGIFGVPSFVIGGDMFFGDDCLDLLGHRPQERVTDSPDEADRSAVMTRGPRPAADVMCAKTERSQRDATLVAGVKCSASVFRKNVVLFR